jgi:hypothetical protein
MEFIVLFRHAGSQADRVASRALDVDALAGRILGDPAAPQSLTILVGIDEPRELGLYRDGADFAPPYDLVLRGAFADDDALDRAVRLAGAGLDSAHVYAVEETVVKAAPRRNGRVPGIHMMHPLFLHEDLPRSALLRSWREIHADLAVKVHVGADSYSQFLVLRQLGEGPAYGGFSDFQFPSHEALMTGYFDSDRGRSEIRHDIRHFIRGLPPRLFATQHRYGRQ